MKTLIYTTGIAFLMMIFPNYLSAQNQTGNDQKAKQENVSTAKDTFQGKNFIDENNNGVCDRFENAKPLGKGPNFIDSDKNGICDNREKGNRGNGRGYGYQHRNGQRNGQCCGRGPCGGKGWKNR
jgi:hypothetical protein